MRIGEHLIPVQWEGSTRMGGVQVFQTGGWLRELMEAAARTYMERKDGSGSVAAKMYWMEMEQGLNYTDQVYVFGSSMTSVYRLFRQPQQEQAKLFGKIATEVLRRVRPTAQIPPKYKTWTVVCRYAKGHGVGPHKDKDYKSEVDYIISFSPVGRAVFRMHPNGGAPVDVRLEPGSVVLFDRNLRHEALPAEEPRINITVRYGQEGVAKMFIRPQWYHFNEEPRQKRR